jgi:hypothetical protein
MMLDLLENCLLHPEVPCCGHLRLLLITSVYDTSLLMSLRNMLPLHS